MRRGELRRRIQRFEQRFFSFDQVSGLGVRPSQCIQGLRISRRQLHGF